MKNYVKYTFDKWDSQETRKKTLWPLFYGWGSTASRLKPLWGGSLLFVTKFPETSGTHFIDLGRMKCWLDLGATQWFWTRDPWNWKFRTLTTRPLMNFGHSIPLDECPNPAKLLICEGKKKCLAFQKIGNHMLFFSCKLLFKIFLLPICFLKQVFH